MRRYCKFGAEHFFFEKSEDLSSLVTLEVDSNPMKMPEVKGIVVLNLPNCYGGRLLWGSLFFRQTWVKPIAAVLVSSGVDHRRHEGLRGPLQMTASSSSSS